MIERPSHHAPSSISPPRRRIRLSSAPTACCAALAVLAVAAPVSAQSTTTLVDTELLDADWSHAVVLDPGLGPPTLSVSRDVANGNPAPSQSGVRTYIGPGEFLASHLFATVHDPSVSGAIVSVDGSYDLRSTGGAGLCGGTNAFRRTISSGLALEQAGQLFVAAPGYEGADLQEGWLSISRLDLEAEDFGLVDEERTPDFGTNPDFGAAAPPIQFGYVTSNTTGESGGCTRQWEFDNFQVVIDSEGSSSVPLLGPGWVLLLAGALVAVGARALPGAPEGA